MSSFKTVAAFVGGLLLGAIALSMSSPEERMSGELMAEGPGGVPGQSPEMGLLPADGAEGPLPPPGTPHLPPEGAGTMLPDGMVPAEAAPEVGGEPGAIRSSGKGPKPVAGVLLLDEHLTQAEARWWQIRGRVTSSTPGGQELLTEIDALVTLIPDAPNGMPPLQEVVRFLVAERLLLDRLAAADVDVEEAAASLDRLLSPPKGKIEDGQDKAVVPGGAGQAPDGTRPLDPSAPRRALEPG